MRIGIDGRMFGPQSTTGIGAYIKYLTENIFVIDKDNEYVLFLKEPAFSEFTAPNERIKKVKVDIPWYSLAEQLKYPRILLKEKLDLMHFPHFNACIFYPKKFIITIHDITPKFFPGPLVKRSLLRRLGFALVFRLSLYRAKKILTISGHTKENLMKYYKVSGKKIEVIYLGVDQSFSRVSDETRLSAVKNRYALVQPFLLYVGIWRDHKNLVNLVKAFEILKTRNRSDLRLVLAGQPDDRFPEISKAVNDSPYRSDIICPGFIDQADLPAVYTLAKIFVLPSFCEGFGLVALEAMACGTPVCGSNTTSLPEILQGDAVYFDPNYPQEIAQAASKLLDDEKLFQNLKNSGLLLKNKYQWPKTAAETLKVYTHL